MRGAGETGGVAAGEEELLGAGDECEMKVTYDEVSGEYKLQITQKAFCREQLL